MDNHKNNEEISRLKLVTCEKGSVGREAEGSKGMSGVRSSQNGLSQGMKKAGRNRHPNCMPDID